MKAEKNDEAELQHKMDDTDGLTLPRCSERPSVPTEKMLSYQKEELSKKEKKTAQHV